MKKQYSLLVGSLLLPVLGGVIGGCWGSSMTVGDYSTLGGNELNVSELVSGHENLYRANGEVQSSLLQLSEKVDSMFSTPALERTSLLPPPPEGGGRRSNRADLKDSSFRWIGVLPVEIARSLVVRGLTPFDGGKVAACVRAASDSFERSQEQYRLGISELNEQYSLGHTSADQFSLIQDRIDLAHREQKNEAIQVLSDALDALSE